MRARTWLRIAAAVLAVHTIAHTAGSVTSNNRTTGVEGLITTMRNFHFSIMGSDRTAWDFFHGLGLLFAANLAILTVLSWQADDLSVADPVGARPIVFTLIAANTLILILSSIYFFAVPIVLSGLAAACLSVASVRLNKTVPKPEP